MRFRGALLLCFTLFLPSQALPSSRTEAPGPAEHLTVCGSNYLYLKNFGAIFSRGTREARIKARASVTVRHPKAEPSGNKTVFEVKFHSSDFLNFISNLFEMHEQNGCDRLRYNHDAKLQTIDDYWLITGSFKYEERICTSSGSISVLNSTRQVNIKISPIFKIVGSGSSTRLITSMKATYDVPVFLTVKKSGDIFNFNTKEIKLPGIFSANLEGSNFSISNSNNGLYSITKITLRPVPEGVSCFFAQELGEELWESGDWGRIYEGD